ncbi:MAG TPA: TIGR03067 domain-containing protein [Gemmataceae bacterium]|jgi:uncharacterized protein (TIGR03067 family)|nr:TIGR03067 domain-containing protein [Gemmataceae bacterium]
MIRHVTFAVGLVCLAGFAAAAPAPKVAPKDDKADLKKLEGDWAIESWTQFGAPVGANWTWTIKGDKYTLDQGTNLEEGTLKLDPKKEPAVMDLEITGGNCKGKDQPGIYKLEGDTLTLCFGWPGTTERPTEFRSTAENRWILITLKRAKK